MPSASGSFFLAVAFASPQSQTAQPLGRDYKVTLNAAGPSAVITGRDLEFSWSKFTICAPWLCALDEMGRSKERPKLQGTGCNLTDDPSSFLDEACFFLSAQLLVNTSNDPKSHCKRETVRVPSLKIST